MYAIRSYYAILGHRIRYMLRAQKATESLKRNEERYRLLFNSGNDVACVYQLRHGELPGRFIEANTVALQKLGYLRQDLSTLTPLDFVPDEKKEQLLALGEKVVAERHCVMELDVLTKEGVITSYSIHYTKLYEWINSSVMLRDAS